MENQNEGSNQANELGANLTQIQAQTSAQVQSPARETFVAVQKNGDGDITSFKTDSGRILDYEQALQEVHNGIIQGVNAFKGRDGDTYIRGDADGDPSNNLGNLPIF